MNIITSTLAKRKNRIISHKRPRTDILEISNLHAEAEGKKILKGITLSIASGEIHAVMGPNGSGKSTLLNTIMGHSKYKITKGSIKFNGKNILTLAPYERARLGLFLGFQYPVEIPGVSFLNFLKSAKNAKAAFLQPRPPQGRKRESFNDFINLLKEKIKSLKMDKKFIERSVNEGFSGGEKKKSEIIQMMVLEPKIALLDEADSGLDIDALKIAANGIKKTFKRTQMGILLITHYQRILNYITPRFVHIMLDGRIVKSGTAALAKKLEKKGYRSFIENCKL